MLRGLPCSFSVFSGLGTLPTLPFFPLAFFPCLLIARAFLTAPATGTLFHFTCHPCLFLGHELEGRLCRWTSFRAGCAPLPAACVFPTNRDRVEHILCGLETRLASLRLQTWCFAPIGSSLLSPLLSLLFSHKTWLFGPLSSSRNAYAPQCGCLCSPMWHPWVEILPAGRWSFIDEGRALAAPPPGTDLDQFLASSGCTQKGATLVPNGL